MRFMKKWKRKKEAVMILLKIDDCLHITLFYMKTYDTMEWKHFQDS